MSEHPCLTRRLHASLTSSLSSASTSPGVVHLRNLNTFLSEFSACDPKSRELTVTAAMLLDSACITNPTKRIGHLAEKLALDLNARHASSTERNAIQSSRLDKLCLEEDCESAQDILESLPSDEFDPQVLFSAVKCRPSQPCTWSLNFSMCAVCLLGFEAQLSSREVILMRMMHMVADRLLFSLERAWWLLRGDGSIGPSASEAASRRSSRGQPGPNTPPLVALGGGGPSRWPLTLARPRTLTPLEFLHVERMPCKILAMLHITSLSLPIATPAPSRADRLRAQNKNKSRMGKSKIR